MRHLLRPQGANATHASAEADSGKIEPPRRRQQQLVRAAAVCPRLRTRDYAGCNTVVELAGLTLLLLPCTSSTEHENMPSCAQTGAFLRDQYNVPIYSTFTTTTVQPHGNQTEYLDHLQTVMNAASLIANPPDPEPGNGIGSGNAVTPQMNSVALYALSVQVATLTLDNGGSPFALVVI